MRNAQAVKTVQPVKHVTIAPIVIQEEAVGYAHQEAG